MAADNATGPVRVNGLILDPQRWEAQLDGRPLRLTRTEFHLLLVMAREPGRAFSRDELLDAVWGPGYLAGSNVVDQAMAGLRRKLGDDPRRPSYIQTVTGIGYRLRGGEATAARRPGLLALVGGLGVLLAVGALVAALLAVWLTGDDPDDVSRRSQSIRFHSTAQVTDQGSVTGADCSEDLVIADTESESRVTGDVSGDIFAISTTRLYQDTDCLSGVSEASNVFTDDDGNTIEASTEAPIITYRLPDLPDTAVNHQVVSATITGGTGKYAGVSGEGTCTTLSLSNLSGEELEATSESDCQWTLTFPLDGEPAPDSLTLDLSVSPARLSTFGNENGVPSQGLFLAVVRNGSDDEIRDATLILPQPAAAMIQARATCGSGISAELCSQDSGTPPRGSRTWRLGTVPAHDQVRFEFTLQLLDAPDDTVPVQVELDGQGLSVPLKSRRIEIEVVR